MAAALVSLRRAGGILIRLPSHVFTESIPVCRSAGPFCAWINGSLPTAACPSSAAVVVIMTGMFLARPWRAPCAAGPQGSRALSRCGKNSPTKSLCSEAARASSSSLCRHVPRNHDNDKTKAAGHSVAIVGQPAVGHATAAVVLTRRSRNRRARKTKRVRREEEEQAAQERQEQEDAVAKTRDEASGGRKTFWSRAATVGGCAGTANGVQEPLSIFTVFEDGSWRRSQADADQVLRQHLAAASSPAMSCSHAAGPGAGSENGTAAEGGDDDVEDACGSDTVESNIEPNLAVLFPDDGQDYCVEEEDAAAAQQPRITPQQQPHPAHFAAAAIDVYHLPSKLWEPARASLDIPNAGGRSEVSEAYSIDYFHRVHNVSNVVLENEISYWASYKMCDFLCSMPTTAIKAATTAARCAGLAISDGEGAVCTERLGVSVTRAMAFPHRDSFDAEAARRLITKKVSGLIVARNMVDDQQSFFCSVLHVWAQTPEIARLVAVAYHTLDLHVLDRDKSLRGAILLVVTICPDVRLYQNIR